MRYECSIQKHNSHKSNTLTDPVLANKQDSDLVISYFTFFFVSFKFRPLYFSISPKNKTK